MWAKNKQSGFTIVELLIVIVVIGILAAITIVAYNGIQQRAQTATLQSDLEGAAKQLAMDQVTNSAYPATVAAANNGAGLKASPGTSYSYIVNNSITPVYYCLAETNTASSLTYFVNSTTNTPQVGGCSVTNLVTNPGVELSVSPWQAPFGTWNSGNLDTSQQYSGATSYKATRSAVSSDARMARLVLINLGVGSYEYSSWVYVADSAIGNLLLTVEYAGSVGAYGVAISSGGAIGRWVRVSVPFTVTTAGNVYINYCAGLNQIGSIYIDAALLTVGPTLYNYADGNSPNWSWTGTPNASTSTGPPL